MASNEHTPILACSQLMIRTFNERNPELTGRFRSRRLAGLQDVDRWWGFPTIIPHWAIYYNQAMFDEAGIEHPGGVGSEPWTVGEFVEVAKALTKPDGSQWGVWYPALRPISISTRASSTRAGATSTTASPVHHRLARVGEGLQFIVDLMHTHKVALTPAELAGGDIDYFASVWPLCTLTARDLMGKNQTSD